MNVEELEEKIGLILSTLHLSVNKVNAGQHLPKFYVVETFGIVVVGINGQDYTHVLSKLTSEYIGYRYFFIEVEDKLLEKKQELIWDLMRAGYMRHIRHNYPRQFRGVLNNNFGRQIIEERLRIWNDKPKYKYWIEDNKMASKTTINYVLANDASFFDYMPEEEKEES